MDLMPPSAVVYWPILENALREDLGRAGDLTSDAIVDPDHMVEAVIDARPAGRIAGLAIATEAFSVFDPSVSVELLVADGAAVEAGTDLARVRGRARSILAAERTVLNLLGRLCGIATTTATIADQLVGTGAAVADTRKTTPGLRALEKYAVRCGGGANHRFGLDDAVLIKDNHLAVAGSVTEAVRRVRERVGHMVKIELEVDNVEQLREAMDVGVEAVLLDNMTPEQLQIAVGIVDGRATTNASGGITPETARTIAETGVDILSVGFITHSAPNFDVGLDF
jgi:nicotinate-nucleotide pyrophosphorylase (carboxylating)